MHACVLPRCCRWRCTLFISNRSRAHRDKPYQQAHHYWAWDQLDAHHLYTGAACPALLLLLRLFNVAFFVFTVLWTTRGPKCCASRDAADWMTYFTNWQVPLFTAATVLFTCMRWMDMPVACVHAWSMHGSLPACMHACMHATCCL